MNQHWLHWQLVDSAFPSGGFAHSAGLEAAWQHHVVHDANSLEDFLHTSLLQVDLGLLRLVRAAWKSPENFLQLDAACDLFLNNHVANHASRAQGRAMLASSSKTFSRDEFESLLAQVRRDSLAAHWPIVFGFVTRTLGISLEDASEIFRFITVRGWLSAAVRLGIIGPLHGQRMQASFANVPIARDDENCEPVQTSPILDLLQGTQDRLYSRLFQS